MTENNPFSAWNLRMRHDQLPKSMTAQLKAAVVEQIGEPEKTMPAFFRVLNGGFEQNRNLKVLRIYSETLGCSINDLMDPDFSLADHVYEQRKANESPVAQIDETR